MASLTVRRLDVDTKARLRVQAAHRGHSMEEEAREILTAAVARRKTDQGNLAKSIRARFAALGGVDVPHTPREPMRPPPRFVK